MKKTYRRYSFIVICIMLLVGVVGALLSYTFVLSNKLAENNRIILKDNTTLVAKVVHEALVAGQENIEILGKMVEHSLTGPEFDVRHLQGIINSSVFDFMEFADKDGKNHNITGGLTEASDRQYFIDAKEGNCGMESFYISRATNETLIVFYYPIMYKGEFVGSLIGAYQGCNRLVELLSTNYFNEQATSYLLSSDARVIASSNGHDPRYEMYLCALAGGNKELKKELWSSFKTKGVSLLKLPDNKVGGCLMKVPGFDYYIVQIFPPQAGARMLYGVKLNGYLFTGFLIVIFLLFTVMLGRIIRDQFQRRILNNELHEEKHQTEVLKAISNIFNAIFYVNIKDRSYHQIFTSNPDLPMSSESKNIESEAIAVIEGRITPVFRNSMKEFLNINTLEERINGKKSISHIYLSTQHRWMRCNIIPVTLNKQGEVATCLITTRDSDEEIRYKNSQDNIVEAFASPYEVMYVLNGETGVAKNYRMNDHIKQTYDKLFKEGPYNKLIRLYVDNDVVEEDKELFDSVITIKNVRQVLANTSTFSFKYRVIRNGVKVYYQCLYVKPDNDREEYMLGFKNVDKVVKREIAQQQVLENALQEAKKANKAKSEFLFNMSHDIRTPMNAIMGFTELLKKHIDDKDSVLKYIRKIELSNNFLLSLINSLLEMARIESGKETLDENTVDVYLTIESLLGLFEEEAGKKNIVLEKSIDVQHTNILVDETKLREIHLNIMSNAIKYTPSGGKIQWSLKELPSDREGYVIYRVIIEDNGIGMSKEFIPHIFEPFTREKSSTASGMIGTGLGMPIVKRIVDLMEGKIEVESELGKGTKFTLTLPHRLSDYESSEISANIASLCENVDFKGKRILLAEDNELNAEIAIEMLNDEGFIVELAKDGIECVSKLEHSEVNYYDLILMDVQMPHMDGYKATRVIRRIPDPVKSNIPIIAMTANAFDEDMKNAYRAGMNAHLSKPIQIELVKRTIAKILVHTEYDSDSYRSWCEGIKGSKIFSDFEKKHNNEGRECGIFIYEATGEEKILYADKRVINMFRCSSFGEFIDFVNGSFQTMVHPIDIKRVEDEIDVQIRNSEDSIDRVKYKIITKDKSVRYIDDLGRKFYTDNGISIFIVFVADVTEEINEE